MKLIHLLLAASLAVVLTGCSPSEETAEKPAGPTSSAGAAPRPIEATAPEGEGDMQMAVFRNKDGEIVCPMMGAVISDPSKAVGHVDHEGVRYYLCCDACKELEKDGAKAKQLAEEKFPDGKAE